jgi:hypothetical protein
MLKNISMIMYVHTILMVIAEHWFYFIFVMEHMAVQIFKELI